MRIFLTSSFFMWSALVHAQTVKLAVAANFAAPMQEIAAAFERDTGHQISISQAATGVFYEQIRRGAPFDVLLAADEDTAEKLVSEEKAVAGSSFTYALGKLVLWSADPTRVDAKGEVLVRGSYQHLAMANPKTAPYGRAAIQVLQALGLQASTLSRWVQGDNIGQAYQFVATGNAELGFVALSQVWRAGKLKSGSMWLIPAALYQPIRQDAVLLIPGRSNPAARALLDYLRRDKARALIRDWGYELP